MHVVAHKSAMEIEECWRGSWSCIIEHNSEPLVQNIISARKSEETANYRWFGLLSSVYQRLKMLLTVSTRDLNGVKSRQNKVDAHIYTAYGEWKKIIEKPLENKNNLNLRGCVKDGTNYWHVHAPLYRHHHSSFPAFLLNSTDATWLRCCLLWITCNIASQHFVILFRFNDLFLIDPIPGFFSFSHSLFFNTNLTLIIHNSQLIAL